MRHNHKPPVPAPAPAKPEHPEVPIAFKAALTVPETAEIMSIGTTSVRQLIKANKLKVVRVGTAIIIARAEIERFLAVEAGATVPPSKEIQTLMAIAHARAAVAVSQQANARLNEVLADYKAEKAKIAN